MWQRIWRRRSSAHPSDGLRRVSGGEIRRRIYVHVFFAACTRGPSAVHDGASRSVASRPRPQKGRVQVGEGPGSTGVGVALAVGVELADGVAVAVGVREGVRVGVGLGAATVTLGVGGALICTGQPFSA